MSSTHTTTRHIPERELARADRATGRYISAHDEWRRRVMRGESDARVAVAWELVERERERFIAVWRDLNARYPLDH
jgi:hypothetical protein